LVPRSPPLGHVLLIGMSGLCERFFLPRRLFRFSFFSPHSLVERHPGGTSSRVLYPQLSFQPSFFTRGPSSRKSFGPSIFHTLSYTRFARIFIESRLSCCLPLCFFFVFPSPILAQTHLPSVYRGVVPFFGPVHVSPTLPRSVVWIFPFPDISPPSFRLQIFQRFSLWFLYTFDKQVPPLPIRVTLS